MGNQETLYDSLEVTMTMNVNLSPQLDEMVRQKVASGLYTGSVAKFVSLRDNL